MKKLILRFMNSFCYSIVITLIVQLIVTMCTKQVPMMPEYMNHFDNIIVAFAVQLILIGIMSGITAIGMVVFEAKKLGIVFQSILFLIIMLSAWTPVSCIVWNIHRYKLSMIATIVSVVVTYAICWTVAFCLCRKDVMAINEKLSRKKDTK